ncbi:MAG TPA: glycoside hydrolase domain-containing protein [Gemmatimonadaceae bacterium]|jgi:hypothetical protein
MMKLKAARNVLMLCVMTGVASIEAHRLTHEPLAAATADFIAAPTALANAVGTVASNVRASHVGFDTNIYPGDGAMDAWRRSGEYEWVGYYLKGACHSDGSWSGKRARLTDAGWGLAVIYVGQQTWGKQLDVTTTKKVITVKSKKSKHVKHITRTMTRKSTVPVANASDGCSASYVNTAQGLIDARDAIAKTAREGFPRGTTVFLDVEPMNGSVPQRMRDYYREWAQTVLDDGRYRPGIYAHTKNASTIYDDVSDVYDDAGVTGDPAFWIAGSSGFSTDKQPTDVGHTFATAWQGVLDVMRTHNGVKLPVDISVASVASPSAVQ